MNARNRSKLLVRIVITYEVLFIYKTVETEVQDITKHIKIAKLKINYDHDNK